MPKVALIIPIATGTRSRGNASRTRPNASGKVAAPRPCTARPAISSPMDGASAQSSVPRANNARLISSSRRFPNMSPRRPSSPVATDADSRNALSTQVAVVVGAASSRWMSGSAGTTIVCINENDNTATSRAVNGAAPPPVPVVGGNAAGAAVYCVMATSLHGDTIYGQQ